MIFINHIKNYTKKKREMIPGGVLVKVFDRHYR
jgi:hypothetical protein